MDFPIVDNNSEHNFQFKYLIFSNLNNRKSARPGYLNSEIHVIIILVEFEQRKKKNND